jgi:spermidine synthase
VLWARDFALALGATATGTALVLSAFFAGLSAGAALGSRLSRRASGAALYAALEAGIGALVLVYLVAVRPLLGDLASSFVAHESALSRIALQWLLALAVLIGPTTLMGATLPAAVAAVRPRDASLVARLYAWNTLGGATGALGALLAVYALGTKQSFLLAAGLDLAIAAIAATLRRSLGEAPGDSGSATRPARDSAERPAGSPDAPAMSSVRAGAPWIAAGLVGFAGLADEVLWSRGLAGVLSNSVYSIALVLAAVLLGLVAGARLANALLRARGNVARPLVIACIGLAASTLVSREALRLVPQAALALASALRVAGPGGGLAVEALLGMGVVFVPAVCLGTIFPLCVAAARGSLGEALGRVLAANTVGGLVGAPAAAFILLPRLGLGGGLVATSAVAAVAGLAAAERAATRLASIATVGCIGLVAALSPGLQLPWLGRYGAERLLSYRDGAAATVLVTADGRGQKRLLVNGQYSLGGTEGILLERRQAHVPLLLHPAPQRVLVLGVGTGATLGAALAYPGTRIDAVEIVPEVIEAAQSLFAEDNAGALDRPEVRVATQDARTFLRTTPERYDVILSDLFLPWTAGTAYLYSRELLELGQSRLAPGGLYCQWLPLHQLELADLQSIAATFASVFPHVELWLAYHRAAAPIAALVGSSQPIALDRDALAARLRDPILAQAARAVGLDDAADLPALRVAGDAQLRRATAAAAPISDDHPLLEFTAPRAYFHQPGLAIASLEWMSMLLDDAAAHAGSDAARRDLLGAQLALLRGDGPGELRAYLAALQAEPDLPAARRALLAIERSRLAVGDTGTASAIAERIAGSAPESEEAQRATAALRSAPPR